jgi:TonB-dependent SusC/RagA subfamily outer membrane receptor
MLVLCTSAVFAQQGGRGRGGSSSGNPPPISNIENRPLIIVDGVIVSDACQGLMPQASAESVARIEGAQINRIAGLGPDEIENVEVLKGAAAAALYGARAANGVVRITTKKGEHYCIDRSPELNDPFAVHLFPPDLIMANQREIGLQDRQREAIVSELQQSQATFVELQWKLSSESEQLEALLQASPVNEQAALAQIDRVLAAEREIKRVQVGMLIRIRNTLTPQQQAKLTELRGGRRWVPR